MKKFFSAIFSAVVLFAACQKNEIAEPSRDGQVLYATIEDWASTRTVMDEDNNVRWSEGDQIVAFVNSTLGLKYQVTASSVGQTSASFDEVGSGGLNAGTELDHIIAYYPYSSAVKVAKSGADYALEVALPSEQTYAHESFGNGSFPMVAVSQTNNITFRNVCGGMKLQLKGISKIASIKVEGKNNEKLSGKASVTAYTDASKPSVVMADDASTSAVLNCGSGVQLNQDDATDFIISLPPTVFTKGFTITVTDVNGGAQVIETSKSNTVLRSSLLKMPVVTVEITTTPQEGDYVDEYGINHGQGIEIDGVVWAPVNCGYHAVDFKYGKLYQWGRKYGQGYDGYLYDGDWDQTYSDAYLPEVVTGPVSLATGQSKDNEDKFYHNMYTPWDWCTPQYENLWNSGTEDNPVKTKYDPCPEGWRVPTYVELERLSEHSSWKSKDGQNGGWFSGTNSYSESVTQVFFSAAGYRDYDGTARDRGNWGSYWSSQSISSKAGFLSFGSYLVCMHANARTSGYSVRCVKDSHTGSESSVVDLSKDGSANCYIVSEAGMFKFTPTRGNSSESVGAIASAETLWETFGTYVTPNVGDLVKNVKYENGMISFETPSTFKEGNAVIAAKDANGTILWSWHLWLTDKPEEQVYYNNAGTMMDRNLGATSATPGDVEALGLLYQWGRKDPFLGSSSISEGVEAMSTAVWPNAIPSTSLTGTIEYAITNPMSFISRNEHNVDWLYTGDYSTDKTRWKSYSENKSIYDPCPMGWRVPEGGDSGIGIWSRACDCPSAGFNYSYDSINAGMDFSGKFGSATHIWYPAAGNRSELDGSLGWVNLLCEYWSATPSYGGVGLGSSLTSWWDGTVHTSSGAHLSNALSVRCVKESSVSDLPSVVNLSVNGTANCYIVSETAIYEFFPVRGNSTETVGNVASVEVLWESFGTNVTPSVGDLVRDVSYSGGLIRFSTPSPFKEGNAVIAAKDANGNILWSWHIWLTEQPDGQVYYNDAGTIMDRNLGATSATPGDVGALGLLYQWGRKDPFLGSSSINEDIFAKSSGTWPSSVSSDSRGTIEYAISHPMTFITANENNSDWYYVTDNTRWTTSDEPKSIYDPCPVGWRVPDGGEDGVWSKALGASSYFIGYPYDTTSEGMNFSGKFGSAATIWYPASGCRNWWDEYLENVGDRGLYWSASPSPSYFYAFSVDFSKSGGVNPSHSGHSRASGYSVRCVRE